MVGVSAEEKYQYLFMHMINGFAHHKLITDEKGKPIDYEFLEINPAFERMTGIDSKKSIGKRVTEVIPDIQKDPANWIGRYGKVALTGKSVVFENYAAGLNKWFRVSAYSSEKGYFTTVVEDITEIKKSEDRFRRFAENARDVIFRMMLSDGSYEYVSPAAEEVFGYSPEEFYKTPLLIKQILPADWQDYFIEQWQKILKGEILPEYEYQIIHKSGEIRWLNQRNILVRDDNGKPIAMEGIATDITERKNDEIKLKELLDLRNNFIKIVSHQLQTPLEVTRWTLNSVLRGESGAVNEGQRKLIQMALKANTTISSQLDDLVVMIDIEEKRIVLNKSMVQMESLLQSVFNEFKEQANVKKIKMDLILPKKPLNTFEVDADRFKDIFRKLIDNAIVYNRENGSVTVKLFTLGKNLRFEITDTGVGIPKEEQNLIFRHFYRASNARAMKEDSSGVALSIVKYFIEEQGGKIGLESKEGIGTTFWFEIPITSQI